MYRHFFWEIMRPVTKIVVCYQYLHIAAMVSPHRKRLADCINVSWHMHGCLVHGLLYFHAYSMLPCMVQQFATLLGLPQFPVPLPHVHDTWYPNGNNKKPHFGGYSNKFYISCIELIDEAWHYASTVKVGDFEWITM